MLDEDMEVILNDYYMESNLLKSQYKPSILVTVSGVFSLITSFICKKMDAPVLYIPSLIVASCAIMYKGFEGFKQRQLQKNIVELNEILRDMRNLNGSVSQYIKIRHDVKEHSSNEHFQSITTEVKDLLSYMYKQEMALFIKIKSVLIDLSKYDAGVAEDVLILNDINLNENFKLENNSTECLFVLQKLQAIYILFISKLLSYLCIVLNKRVKNYGFKRVIFNSVVPEVIKDVKVCIKNIKTNFDKVKYSKEKRRKFKSNALVKPGGKNIVNRMANTLAFSTTNLSIILEKSETLLNQVQQLKDRDIVKIAPSILDLKNHTYATFEALDVLCKFYDVYSNTKITDTENRSFDTATSSIAQSSNIPSINYDDEYEPKDEEYELEVKSIKEYDDVEYKEVYIEDSGAEYMSLMIQEMKQALSKHKRFVDAKNRRMSLSTTDLNEETGRDTKSPRSSKSEGFSNTKKNPSYKTEQSVLDTTNNCEAVMKTSEGVLPNYNEAMKFSETEVGTKASLLEIGDSAAMRSFAESIKFMANNRMSVSEEVFGDDETDNEDVL